MFVRWSSFHKFSKINVKCPMVPFGGDDGDVDGIDGGVGSEKYFKNII